MQLPTLEEAEIVARWKNSSNGDLVLNNDGKLWERNTLRSKYKLVSPRASGMDALQHAAKQGFELVGTVIPADFTPPEETKMAEAEAPTTQRGRDGVAAEYYERVEAMLADGSVPSKQAAFQALAEEYNLDSGSISTSYYRESRRRGGGSSTSTARRPARDGAARIARVAVPEDLANYLAMIRAGQHAFEQLLQWVATKEQELKEREESIHQREQEAKERIQAQLESLFK